MANLNVSFEELAQTSATIETSRDNIYNELDTLRNRIDQLVSSGFVTDKTSGAFQEAYNKYTTGARNTIQGLDDVIAFLKKVESTLRETDAQLAASIG
jgi:WXG100 family type VII secretion target